MPSDWTIWRQLYRSSTHRQTLTFCCCGVRVVRRLIDAPALEDRTISLRTPLALLLISLGASAAVWWWLAIPINLARAPIDANAKLHCISYAPFRNHQSPATQVLSREQIAEDLAQLAKITDCIRTYATDVGLDQIP